jgi:hypothetical protein
MTEAYHANSTGAASCDDEGAAAALGIAKWLCLAATPTFAIMALMNGCSRRGPDGYALLGRAWVSADRNGPDVHADERLPFGALAEADLQAAKRCPTVLIPLSPTRTVANLPNGEKAQTAYGEQACA